MTRHTPGPWSIDDDGVEPIIRGALRDDGLEPQVAVVRVGLRETQANAALIIAAPVLLEAAREAEEELLRVLGLTTQEPGGSRAQCMSVISRLHAAIAAAEPEGKP